MRLRRVGVVTSLVLGSLIVGSPAGAAQMTARERPSVQGPLRVAVKHCQARRVRFEDRVVGVTRSCIRFYRLRASRENDAARDYGALWLQATVNPREGWCVRAVKSDISVPSGARLHARRPNPVATESGRRARTRLVVDARDQAPTPGVIRQDYTLFPRGVRAFRISEGDAWRTAWRGSKGAVVGLPSGIEVSWRAGHPPARVESNLGYELQRRSSC
jgi:hypothetical protein